VYCVLLGVTFMRKTFSILGENEQLQFGDAEDVVVSVEIAVCATNRHLNPRKSPPPNQLSA